MGSGELSATVRDSVTFCAPETPIVVRLGGKKQEGRVPLITGKPLKIIMKNAQG